MSTVTRSAVTQPASTLVERAARLLREEILAGKLRPDARIHIYATAARLEMSPIPIREALRTLASEGLVTPLAQRGYRVRSATVDDLDDVYNLRMILEPTATRMAVPRLNAEDLAHLGRVLTTFEEAVDNGDDAAELASHRAFHFGLFEASGSRWLVALLNILWANSERYRRMSMPHRAVMEQRAREQREILDACVDGNVELAEMLMRQHLDRAYGQIRAWMARLMPQAEP